MESNKDDSANVGDNLGANVGGNLGASLGDNLNANIDIDLTNCSVELNKTFTHTKDNVSFGDLPTEVVNTIFKDGRAFSHFIEKWLETKYPVKHIPGCKSYDFVDVNNENIKYDEKTFTQKGCSFCPSNMLGQGRTFNKEEFESKTKKLIFCIVSNIHFPNIKIRFVRGIDLLTRYPKAKIPLKDFDKFFN